MKKFSLIFVLLLCAMPLRAVGPLYVASTAGLFLGGSACNGQEAITPATLATTPLTGPETVYFCGTFSTLSSFITLNNGGTSGNLITVIFDTGASIAPAYCPSGGCINFDGLSYVMLNGGAACGIVNQVQSSCSSTLSGTGIIQNTANGSALANQQPSKLISCNSCNYVTVENLILGPVYVQSGGTAVIDQSEVNCIVLNGSNNSVHDNTCHDAGFATEDFWQNGDANDNWYNNVIYNYDHGYILAGPTSTATGGPFWFHDSYIYSSSNWDTGTNAYHHDSFHCWSGLAAGQTINGLYLYNMKMEGPLGANFNSFAYIEGVSGPPCMTASSTGYMFNNLFIQDSTFPGTQGEPWQISGNWAIYNNTSLGYGNSTGPGSNYELTSDASATFLNNASTKNTLLMTLVSVSWASGSPNYNLYSLDSFSSSTPFYVTGNYYTFANYKSNVGGAGEANSVNPSTSNISYTTGIPTGSSAAVGAGTNLYSIGSGGANPGIGALIFDLEGNARPSSGAWTIGALNASGSTTVSTISGATVRGATIQ
jgi:hypothetical protein